MSSNVENTQAQLSFDYVIKYSQLQRSVLPCLMCTQWSGVSSAPVGELLVFWRNAVEYNTAFKTNLSCTVKQKYVNLMPSTLPNIKTQNYVVSAHKGTCIQKFG